MSTREHVTRKPTCFPRLRFVSETRFKRSHASHGTRVTPPTYWRSCYWDKLLAAIIRHSSSSSSSSSSSNSSNSSSISSLIFVRVFVFTNVIRKALASLRAYLVQQQVPCSWDWRRSPVSLKRTQNISLFLTVLPVYLRACTILVASIYV